MARAEAAAWIARLHGPNRTPEVEAGFRRWLSEDPERAAAFELLTDTWEKSALLRRRPFEAVASWERPGFRMSFSRAALATAAVAVFAVMGTIFSLRSDGFSTGVGEQRTLVLQDGSRVYLNTNSRAVLKYDKQARHIVLERGEALFEVARRPAWPFIVTVADKQVRALGTTFVVRRDEDKFAVTLVEGSVEVSSGATVSEHNPQTPQTPELGTVGVVDAGITLTPGERLTFAAQEPPKVDRPAIAKVMAWQRGQVALDNTRLADAVAEMNRYSKTWLVIEDPHAAAIPVSGIFRAGDQDDFARAVAKTYGLEVRYERGAIVLAGIVPESSNPPSRDPPVPAKSLETVK